MLLMGWGWGWEGWTGTGDAMLNFDVEGIVRFIVDGFFLWIEILVCVFFCFFFW